MPVLRQRLQRLDAPQGLRRRRRRGNLAESAQLDVLRGDDSAVGTRAFVRRVLPAALGEVPAVPPPSFPALHVPLQTLNLVHVRAVAHAEVRVHAALHRERARHRAEPAVPPRRHLPRRARRRLAGLVKPARVLQVHLHVLVAGEHQRGVRHFAQPHVQVIVAVARAAVEERADAAVDDGVAGEERLDAARVEGVGAAASVVPLVRVARALVDGRARGRHGLATVTVRAVTVPEHGVHDVPRGVAGHVHDPQARLADAHDVARRHASRDPRAVVERVAVHRPVSYTHLTLPTILLV